MFYQYFDLILTWILFLALFPIAFFWCRSAWRIGVKRDFSSVALKKGHPPQRSENYAPFSLVINTLGFIFILGTIIGVLSASLAKTDWIALAGITIWCKVLLEFVISRHAHRKK